MLGLSGIVLPPEPCGSNSNYHDPNRWHNHLSLPLMPAPIDMVHVPYRGGAPALTDLIAGQVQVMFPSNASAIEYIRAVCPLRVIRVVAGSCQWSADCRNTPKADAKSGHRHLSRCAKSGC
jgi:hypothetical protein